MLELYMYKGAVMNQYGKMIEEKWSSYTWAPSEAKARNNLKHQYNSQGGYRRRKLYLPGGLQKVEVKQKIDDGEQLSFF